ncbi:MAG: BamA/TamA family outer membrane protein [Bacteroidaceae bacterium]|nr:BamA/TamA family outer membrane protein [Bacteroidaceae bacterium]
MSYLCRVNHVKRLIKPVLLLHFLIVLSGCHTSRFIPEDEYLLTGTSVSCEDKLVRTEELQAYMPQRPNSKWFSIFNVPLGIYSLSGRDSTKRFNRFLRHLGEAPVIYDRERTIQACNNMQLAVRNQGYLNAEVLLLEKAKKDKMKIFYRIVPHERYHIHEFSLDVQDDSLRRILDSLDYHPALALNSVHRKPYSINDLDAERSRLYGLLVENGYYKFNKDFVHFRVDTTFGQHLADVKMIVRPASGSADTASLSHRRYHIGNITYDFQDEKPFLRPKVLRNAMAISKGGLYREKDMHETYARLTRLSAVMGSNVRIEERNDDSDTLDVNIMLSPSKRNSFSAELEGTNSAGDFGAAASVTYQNRNLFRGSELFNIKVRGAFEAIKGLSGYADQNFIEYSIESGITFPDFKFPFLRPSFRRNAQATTEVNLAYDSQDRPEFHRRVLTGVLRYRWTRRNRQLQHRFDLLDIDYVFMPWISDTFREKYLSDPQNRNAILKYNYENLFIMNWSYHLSYASRPLGASASNYGTNAYTIRLGLETAGNLLYGITNAARTKQNDDGQYTLFNIAYAQYTKLDFAFCKSFLINKNNSLALHAALGIAVPYGNSYILPYEKRYFSGGANSVRGWSVRELGPGSFKGSDGRIDFINQTGDIKLDLNAEYRTHLFWKIDGAAFIDAGNIWTIRDYKDQPGGQFRFDEFWKQIAVSYGLGLRLNFNFFILRFDAGMKAINPAYTTRREHFPITHPKLKRDFTFHFAVGMPF